MAGIGFELRELLRRDSLWGLVRAYAYAGIISSGPWVLSILGVMGIGLLSVGPVPALEVRQFLVAGHFGFIVFCELDRFGKMRGVQPKGRRGTVLPFVGRGEIGGRGFFRLRVRF